MMSEKSYYFEEVLTIKDLLEEAGPVTKIFFY